MWRSAILVSLAILIGGCDSVDQEVFIPRVTSINGGSPLQADVIVIDEESGAASVPEEIVVATFTNKVYSPGVVTEPTTFWHDFLVTEYSVTWSRADGGPTSGPGWTLSQFNFDGTTSVVVPIGGSADVGIPLGRALMKIEEPFVSLIFGGGITLNAAIDFVGRPANSSEGGERHVAAAMLVTFANWADE